MLLATDLSILAQQGGMITVSNQEPGILVFTDELLKIEKVWQGKGDSQGRDIMQVPASFLANSQFVETVQRGLLRVEQAPEVLQAALDAQSKVWAQRQQARDNAPAEVIRLSDQVVARGVSCIAPEGKELCGAQALVMGQDPNASPPLCAKHANLSQDYISNETGRIIGGRPEVLWTRKR